MAKEPGTFDALEQFRGGSGGSRKTAAPPDLESVRARARSLPRLDSGKGSVDKSDSDTFYRNFDDYMERKLGIGPNQAFSINQARKWRQAYQRERVAQSNKKGIGVLTGGRMVGEVNSLIKEAQRQSSIGGAEADLKMASKLADATRKLMAMNDMSAADMITVPELKALMEGAWAFRIRAESQLTNTPLDKLAGDRVVRGGTVSGAPVLPAFENRMSQLQAQPIDDVFGSPAAGQGRQPGVDAERIPMGRAGSRGEMQFAPAGALAVPPSEIPDGRTHRLTMRVDEQGRPIPAPPTFESGGVADESGRRQWQGPDGSVWELLPGQEPRLIRRGRGGGVGPTFQERFGGPLPRAFTPGGR